MQVRVAGGVRRVEPVLEPGATREALAVQTRLTALLARGEPPARAALPELRRQRREGAHPFPAPWRHPDAVDDEVAGAGGGIPIRILTPPVSRGAYLHVTGGGWCTGAADINDAPLWSIATAAEVTVVCASPRLAPEHPHPAPLDDAEAVLRWFAWAGSTRFGTDRLGAGGDSTGAHLALLAALRVRDAPERGQPLAALNLAVGIFDVTSTASWQSAVSHDPLLDPALLARYVSWLAPDAAAHAALSPLHHDLRGLPPMLLTAAEVDPLCSGAHELAAAAVRAGVDVTLAEYPGASHGFATFATEMAAHALRTQAAHLRHHLTAAPAPCLTGATR